MIRITHKRARQIVAHFKEKRMLVLGDVMLDRYIWGEVSRISPEAPIPVVRVRRESSCLGGAGNVGQNLLRLGAHPVLTGVVGRDPEGRWIREHVEDGRGLFSTPTRPTTVKTRIIAHSQQVVRVDREETRPISPGLEGKIFRFIREERPEGLLISDYNKGLVTPSLVEKVLLFAKRQGIPVFVDPKVDHFTHFSPVTLLTPNHHEAERIVHHECLSDEDVERAGRTILSEISAEFLILKRGPHGLSVFEKGRRALHIPAVAKEVYDVTGAGDTVIAVAALALLAGASIREAAVLANVAAGLVVAKVGTAAITPEELLAGLPAR
ncbi:MAG: D-glycero-beta-D-manno-heptose-7-phosphate kinase [Candidatus Aminicenantales bacterium]